MTGGVEDYDLNTNVLTTTEILEIGKKTKNWKQVGHLPNALQGLRGVSLNNKIFMTGKNLHLIHFYLFQSEFERIVRTIRSFE